MDETKIIELLFKCIHRIVNRMKISSCFFIINGFVDISGLRS